MALRRITSRASQEPDNPNLKPFPIIRERPHQPEMSNQLFASLEFALGPYGRVAMRAWRSHHAIRMYVAQHDLAVREARRDPVAVNAPCRRAGIFVSPGVRLCSGIPILHKNRTSCSRISPRFCQTNHVSSDSYEVGQLGFLEAASQIKPISSNRFLRSDGMSSTRLRWFKTQAPSL